MDQTIAKFIAKHHVMTLATIGENGTPRTANLFYAYDNKNNTFIFTSSLSTAHGSDMERCEKVGANIVLETSRIGAIEGLQIEGVARKSTSTRDKINYLKRFPFAAIADLELWTLSADYMKLTDNKLGFGKKIIWRRQEQE